MDVEFKDLSYTVWPRSLSRTGPGKRILKSVNGRFKYGELSAIMGPSGAGKSSLLNALSGYRTRGVTGTLCTNGKPREPRVFHKLSCYLTQEDFLQPLLTVHEVMLVAAKLKLPSDTSKKQRLHAVDEILTDLGLLECKNTMTEMLSGGQKKRLSIALELINNPPVFFLDEPTSGLDNVTARQVLQLLRTLARQGRTIVCTIHQPSAILFQLFDHVYVVAQGLCVYQGSTKDLVPFLSSVGLPCPTHYNPADYVIELTDGDEQNIATLSEAISNGNISYTRTQSHILPGTQAIEESDEATAETDDRRIIHFEATNDSMTANGRKGGDTSSEDGSNDIHYSVTYSRMSQVRDINYPTSSWFQFWTLMERMLLQISRSRTALQLQFLHHIACGVMVGLVTYQSALDGHEMFKHVKFCLAVIVFHSYTWVMAPVLLFPDEVKLMKKEYFNRWYGLTSYYMALTMSRIPVQAIFGMAFISIVYFMYGLPAELYRFCMFGLVGLMVGFVSEGLGLAIGSYFTVTNGAAFGSLLVAPFLGLAVYGFDFADQISWAMNALMKTSFMRCGIVALVLTVYGLDRTDLHCEDVYCHFKKPSIVLKMLDIQNVSIWHEVGYLFALMMLFRTFCYIGLRWRVAT